LERIYKGLAEIDRMLASKEEPDGELGDRSRELEEKVAGLRERFREAMDDDFNTALAIAGVFDLTRVINRAVADFPKLDMRLRELLTQARQTVGNIAMVLGIFTSKPTEYLERIKSRKAVGLELSAEEIEGLIAERAVARKEKNFKRSDEIRDYLLIRNIELKDSPQGTTWTVK
jgi:cysteinyl-tRNA synthetase